MKIGMVGSYAEAAEEDGILRERVRRLRGRVSLSLVHKMSKCDIRGSPKRVLLGWFVNWLISHDQVFESIAGTLDRFNEIGCEKLVRDCCAFAHGGSPYR